MSGNEPPAGGFGGAKPGESRQIVRLQGTPPRTHIAAIVAAIVVVGGLLGFVYLAGGSELRLARRAASMQGELDLAELRRLVELRYGEDHELCPAAAPIPRTVAELPYHAGLDVQKDPGWSCLGFDFGATRHFQVAFERSGTDAFTLTVLANPTGDLPPGYVQRGHIDAAASAIVWGPVEESRRK